MADRETFEGKKPGDFVAYWIEKPDPKTGKLVRLVKRSMVMEAHPDRLIVRLGNTIGRPVVVNSVNFMQ